MAEENKPAPSTTRWNDRELWSLSKVELMAVQLRSVTVYAVSSLLLSLGITWLFGDRLLSATTFILEIITARTIDLTDPAFLVALWLLLIAAAMLSYFKKYSYRPDQDHLTAVYCKGKPTDVEIDRPIFLPRAFEVVYIHRGRRSVCLTPELTFPDFNKLKITMSIRYGVLASLKWNFLAWGSQGVKTELGSLVEDALLDWSQSIKVGPLNFVEGYENPPAIRRVVVNVDMRHAGVRIVEVRIKEMEIAGPLIERNEDEREVCKKIREQDIETKRLLRLRASEQQERFPNPPGAEGVNLTEKTDVT